MMFSLLLTKGQTSGDQIQGGGYTHYKVRVKNSDAQGGKSGGYRIVYYLLSGKEITLITIYSKSDQADIGAAEILEIIQQEENEG